MNLMKLAVWTSGPQKSPFIPSSLGLTPKVFAEETRGIFRIAKEPSGKADMARHPVKQSEGKKVAQVPKTCGDGCLSHPQ